VEGKTEPVLAMKTFKAGQSHQGIVMMTLMKHGSMLTSGQIASGVLLMSLVQHEF
jgi:hypothetical protein